MDNFLANIIYEVIQFGNKNVTILIPSNKTSTYDELIPDIIYNKIADELAVMPFVNSIIVKSLENIFVDSIVVFHYSLKYAGYILVISNIDKINRLQCSYYEKKLNKSFFEDEPEKNTTCKLI